MNVIPKSQSRIAVIALLLIAVQRATADTYTVNTSSDTVVANACANHTANCSLRGAITAANAHTGDTIVFGINEFCGPGGCAISLSSALPDITAPMSISGPSTHVIQHSASASTNFRIFNVTTSGTVNFTALTIRNGNPVGAGFAGAGGGINNHGSATVNVTNCNITGNSLHSAAALPISAPAR